MSKPVVVFLLAAGFGVRLQPYTVYWPKCLMPINGRPLLEYWLETVNTLKVASVLVNGHHLHEIVQNFLDRPIYKGRVQYIYEPILWGTAGALRSNRDRLKHATVLLAHADNFCLCDFDDFLGFHLNYRKKHSPITMMTFESQDPSNCGIVEIDNDGLVYAFHEKVSNPPGNRANGAVYLLEPEVIEWISEHPKVTDFSTQVLPHFLGRISTWHNAEIHIDIGSIEALQRANRLSCLNGRSINVIHDKWSQDFSTHPIHRQIQFDNYS